MTVTRIYTETRVELYGINSTNNINSAEDRIEKWIKINMGFGNE